MERFPAENPVSDMTNLYTPLRSLVTCNIPHKMLKILHNGHVPLVSYSNLAAAPEAVKQFKNTLNLPHLPVPNLHATLAKYLQSVEPFLNENEFEVTKELVEEFRKGVGRQLQKLLMMKAEKTENWLDDWWINVAYLDYRDPVVVYSSPGLVFPVDRFKDEEAHLTYTAKLILASMDYKKLIDEDKIALDKMGKDLLDMNQYKKIFGTCRIPGLKRDGLEFHPDSRHIVVVKNNNFFKLEILNQYEEVPSVKQLVNDLKNISQNSKEKGPAVGILSSENRDTWGKIYQHLISDPINKKSVTEIQRALFLVCLDNPMPENEPKLTSASKQSIHGGGSSLNSANRWFDKTVQFITDESGMAALTYEHSPSEGQPIAVLTDFLIDYIKKDVSKVLPDSKRDVEPTKLLFNVDDNLNEAIQNAGVHIDKLADNLDMDSFKFASFGKEFIKSQKLSPDSFIQMAMQYAFYRFHKTPGAHYESAATRKYIHGRTETIRSCSNESIAFAKAMLNKSKSDKDKAAALRTAIETHKRYSIEAVNGFGVDRHLLGLKLIAIENQVPVHPLYRDPGFLRSSHMRISSSQVALREAGFMCYGPLVPNGYACCYSPRSHDIYFGVSAFRECPETSAKGYREALEESLRDMELVLARTQKGKL